MLYVDIVFHIIDHPQCTDEAKISCPDSMYGKCTIDFWCYCILLSKCYSAINYVPAINYHIQCRQNDALIKSITDKLNKKQNLCPDVLCHLRHESFTMTRICDATSRDRVWRHSQKRAIICTSVQLTGFQQTIQMSCFRRSSDWTTVRMFITSHLRTASTLDTSNPCFLCFY